MEWVQILLFILFIIIMNVLRNASQRKKRPNPEERKRAHEEAMRYIRQEVPVEVKPPPAHKPKISTVKRAEQTWGFKPTIDSKKLDISLGVPLTAQKKKAPIRKNSLRHMIHSLPSKRSLFALNEILNPPYLPKDRL